METETTIAPLNPSNVLDTIAKFIRVLENEGVEWRHYRYAIDSKTARLNLSKFLKAGCQRILQFYEQAKLILGNDFIEPEDVTKAHGFVYTDENLVHFMRTLPSDGVLRWCRDNDYTVIAGPPQTMSRFEVQTLKDGRFQPEKERWRGPYEGVMLPAYGGEKAMQLYEGEVTADWLVVRKHEVHDSFRKNWDEQRALLADIEREANAAEVMWFIKTYRAVRGITLFERVLVRTSSVTLSDGGGRVSVGDFCGHFCSTREGVNHWQDSLRDSNIGIASVLVKKS